MVFDHAGRLVGFECVSASGVASYTVASSNMHRRTFASSSPSGVAGNLMAYFSFSEEIATLTISLFVAGYCVGPLLWGPLSEIRASFFLGWFQLLSNSKYQYGRRPIFIGTFIVYTVRSDLFLACTALLTTLQAFQVGAALSRNTASLLIFRLLGGTFAAAPLTNSGALISDM